MNKLDFNIKYIFSENKFYIKTKFDFNGVKIEIKNQDSKIIFSENTNLKKDQIFWIFPGNLDENTTSLKITINGQFEEIIKIRTNRKIKIKPVGIWVAKRLGLGDMMFTTPFIRKLHQAYQQKITIFGYPHYEEFFKNNPYINLFIDKETVNSDDIWEKYEIFEIFAQTGPPYWQSDIRQLAAMSAEISLKEHELELDFFPDEYELISELPEKYICINPRVITRDRGWALEQWQTLIDDLNNLNLSVVALGKGKMDYHHNLKIYNGLNLIDDYRQNNLSQTWHLINKSQVFVTFDTGMYVLGGTTDTHMIQIGGTYDPYFHSPIRHGVRDYKVSHIRGNCPIFCTDDITSYVEEHGTIRKLPEIVCRNSKYYACTPSTDSVLNEILKIVGYRL